MTRGLYNQLFTIKNHHNEKNYHNSARVSFLSILCCKLYIRQTRMLFYQRYVWILNIDSRGKPAWDRKENQLNILVMMIYDHLRVSGGTGSRLSFFFYHH